MNFTELNEKLAAAGAPPVYFAKYSRRTDSAEYAMGDYVNTAISIVDRGEYLVWGTSERGEFTEGMKRFATESEMFDYLAEHLTRRRPPPTQLRSKIPEESTRAAAQRATEIFESLRRAQEAGGTS